MGVGKLEEIPSSAPPLYKERTQSSPPDEEGEGGEVMVSGKVLVNVSKYSDFGYGAELKFNCRLQAPEKIDGFDYSKFLAKDGIYSLCFWPQDIEKI